MAKHEPEYELQDELLSAYVDGELAADVLADVERRLAADASARQLLSDLRSLSGVLHSMPKETCPEHLRKAVLERTERIPRSVDSPVTEDRFSRRWLWPVLAVAAALLIMILQPEEPQDRTEVAAVNGRSPERRDAARSVPRLESTGEPEASMADSSSVEPFHAELADEDRAAGSSGAALSRSVPSAESSPPAPFRASAQSESEFLVERPGGDPETAERREVPETPEHDSPVGVVHVQLVEQDDSERDFYELLVANGLRPVPTGVGTPEPAAPVTSGQALQTLSGGDRSLSLPTTALAEEATASDTVLIEAPPEQIERVIYGCSQQTDMVEALHIEGNSSHADQLQQWRRWERSPVGDDRKGQTFSLNATQQAVIDDLARRQGQQQPSDGFARSPAALMKSDAPPGIQQYRPSTDEPNEAEPMQVLFFLHGKKAKVESGTN